MPHLLKTRRSIRFASPEQNSVHVYESRPDDILWATDEEFLQGRRNLRLDGRQTRHDVFGKLLEEAFHKATRDDVQTRLNEYARWSNGRGIERQICKSHCVERKELRAKANQAVLVAQERAREYGLTTDQTWETLSEICTQYCSHASAFARKMGKADEAACDYPSPSSKANKSSSNNKASRAATTATANSKNQVGRAAIKV